MTRRVIENCVRFVSTPGGSPDLSSVRSLIDFYAGHLLRVRYLETTGNTAAPWPEAYGMSTPERLSDVQWQRLLDNMDARQESQPLPPPGLHQPAFAPASNHGLTDFDALHFDPTMTTLEQNGNYNSQPEFAHLAAQAPPARQLNVTDTSISELQRISKELEELKQR